MSDEMKNNRSTTTKNEKLFSVGQLNEQVTNEFLNPVNFVRTNLNILKNSFKDLKEIINKYEFVLDQVNHISNSDTKEIMQEFEKFKEKIEIDSIFADVKQAFKESNYSLDEVEKYTKNSELISNVELN